MTNIPQFSTIPEDVRRRMLAPPQAPIRVVIDADVANEVDDYFALAWMLMRPDVFDIQAVYAAPYSFRQRVGELNEAHAVVERGGPTNPAERALVDRYQGQIHALASRGLVPPDLLLYPHVSAGPERGVETSMVSAKEVFTVLRKPFEGLLHRGSDRYLGDPSTPVDSPAARDLIDRALASSPEDPLRVLGLACVTDIASAILLEPAIIRNMVVYWTSGYPSVVTNLANHSFNLDQDIPAAQLLFSCGVPLVYLPGFYIGQQLSLSLPEVETWIRELGDTGHLLYQRYVSNPLLMYYGIRSVADVAFDWVIWDIIVPGSLINTDWVSSSLTPTPILGDDLTWKHEPGRPLMREATGISRSAIFAGLFHDLAAHISASDGGAE